MPAWFASSSFASCSVDRRQTLRRDVMKVLISRLTLVLVIVMVGLLFPLSSYADNNPLTLACPSGSLQVGVPYSSVLVATGGNLPYTFLALPANSNSNPPVTGLPPGLSVTSSTG